MLHMKIILFLSWRSVGQEHIRHFNYVLLPQGEPSNGVCVCVCDGMRSQSECCVNCLRHSYLRWNARMDKEGSKVWFSHRYIIQTLRHMRSCVVGTWLCLGGRGERHVLEHLTQKHFFTLLQTGHSLMDLR